MKKLNILVKVLPIFCLFLFSKIPEQINVQGYLSSGGQPFQGSTNFTFELLTKPGGALIWSLSTSLTVNKGVYSALLSIPKSNFNPTNLYKVRTKVASTTLLPDMDIVSVPYAYYAKAIEWTNILNRPSGLDDGDDAGGGGGTNWSSVGGKLFFTNGNVGIKTANPATPLHVGLGNSEAVIFGSSNAGLRFLRGGADRTVFIQGGVDGGNSNQIFFSRFGSSANLWLFKVNADQTSLSGRLGIGTTGPAAGIHVSNSTDIAVAKFESDEGNGLFINKDGIVGIGTTNIMTDRRLQVNLANSQSVFFGSNNNGVRFLRNNDDSIFIQGGSGGANDQIYFSRVGSSANLLRFRANADNSVFTGKVSVGTTVDPTYQLDVVGTVKATSFIGNGIGLTNLNILTNVGGIQTTHLNNLEVVLATVNIKYILVVPEKNIRVSKMKCYQATTTSGTYELGIYNEALSSKLAAGTTTSGSSKGFVEVTFSSSIVLTAGQPYWLAVTTTSGARLYYKTITALGFTKGEAGTSLPATPSAVDTTTLVWVIAY